MIKVGLGFYSHESQQTFEVLQQVGITASWFQILVGERWEQHVTHFYDDPQNVAQYVQMSDGYDGRKLIDGLRQYLPSEASVLELGMGPGTDLDLLRQFYKATGSDRSLLFLERYQERHPDADLLQLDAVSLETKRRFDGIYSNKVLYHLTPDELRQSLENQSKVLHPGGVALHSFWYGEGEERSHGLHFTYYTEASLRALFEGFRFEILELGRYTEMETDDSIYVIARRKVHSDRKSESP